jgi:phosphoglycolate phosphatase
VPRVAAVFDIDGTLVTFEFDIAGTRQTLIAELAKRGFDTTGLGMRTPTQLIVDQARSQIESGRIRADFQELRRSLYSILDGFEMASASAAIVFPQTRSTLDHLLAKGVRLAVLTNSGRRAASELLTRSGIRDCFEFVLTRDDVDAMKPRPEGLEKAVSMLKIPAQRVYYVGDSLFDIAAAKKAGLKVVAIATGNYSEAALRAEGADYVIPSISGLPPILGA